MNDGGIWANCDFGTALEQGTADLSHSEPLPGGVESFPFFFVGDEAFLLKPYMIRPYAKPKGRRRQEDEAPRNKAALKESDEDDPAATDERADVDPLLCEHSQYHKEFSIIVCRELAESSKMHLAYWWSSGKFLQIKYVTKWRTLKVLLWLSFVYITS